MTLEKCNSCNATVSLKACFCPSCGASDPLGRGGKVLKGLFITIGAIILALSLFVYSLA
jgi:hypothetical protein